MEKSAKFTLSNKLAWRIISDILRFLWKRFSEWMSLCAISFLNNLSRTVLRHLADTATIRSIEILFVVDAIYWAKFRQYEIDFFRLFNICTLFTCPQFEWPFFVSTGSSVFESMSIENFLEFSSMEIKRRRSLAAYIFSKKKLGADFLCSFSAIKYAANVFHSQLFTVDQLSIHPYLLYTLLSIVWGWILR